MTKPSRSASNGREMPTSLMASSAPKAAVASGVSAASEPPVTTASASPHWIMRAAVPIACAPAAQADSVANDWPRRPCRIDTAAEAELPISSGIDSGETAFGPDSSSFLWLASSVPMPPMPVPISVATRSTSYGISSFQPASASASSEATIANCEKRSERRACLTVRYSVGSNSVAAPTPSWMPDSPARQRS